MIHLSNCTLFKPDIRQSSDAIERTQTISHASNEWYDFLEDAASSKRIKISRKRDPWTRETISNVSDTDSLTCFVPKVDIEVIAKVHTLVERERTKVVHVISHDRLSQKLHQLPIQGFVQNGIILITDENLKSERLDTRIRYHELANIRHQFETLLEDLLDQCA